MTPLRSLLPLCLAGTLAACGSEGLDEPRFATGSSAIVATASYRALVVTNPEENSISRLDLDSRTVTEVSDIGDEPTRIARAGDQLIVTLRGERALAVLDQETLEVLGHIPTGAEPYGVVASEDGTRFYVTLASERVVEEYDTNTLERLLSWPTEQEPRWLALHPNDDDLYVAGPYGGALYWIDLDQDTIATVALPTVRGFSPETGDSVPLTSRIMGDIAVSPDGRTLALPTLQVEHNAPEEDLTQTNAVGSGYYAPPGGGRFNSVVLTTAVLGGGMPSDDLWDASLIDTPHSDLVRVNSHPSSVTFTPSSQELLVTLEAGDAIVAMPVRSQSIFSTTGLVPQIPDGMLQIHLRPHLASKTAEGPRGIALAGDDAYAWAYFSRSVERTRMVELQEAVIDGAFLAHEPSVSMGTPSIIPVEGNTAAVNEVPMYANFGLSEAALRGRRLFYSATNEAVSTSGAGISCSTCHFEGRTDGLTWPLAEGGRQTPSLAGGALETAPVTWTLDVESPSREAFLTSQERMGGSGLSQVQADQIGAYIETIRPVDVADESLDPAAISRGAQVYVDVGCQDCHSGDRYTDNKSYPMLGLANVNTPPLTGIASTAPYFHDGSARTLREVLEFARSGEMGDTSKLNEEEMADLETYLRSL